MFSERLPSDHTRDYPNHSDRPKPTDNDQVSNTPTTPTPVCVNIGTEEDDNSYDYASYRTKTSSQYFFYPNSDFLNISQLSEASNRNRHLYANAIKNQLPAYGDQKVHRMSMNDPGYTDILSDRVMCNDDGIVTKTCVAYNYNENDQD